MSDDRTYNIQLKIDEAALQQAIGGVQRAEAEFEKLRSELGRLAAEGKIAGKTIDSSFSDKEVRGYQSELKRTRIEMERLEAAAEDYGDAAGRASKEVESFGDAASGLSTLRGALGTAGVGGPVGGGLSIAGEALDSVEAVKRLGPALSDVGTKTASIIPGIASAGAGLAVLGTAALGVGAVIGIAALGFSALSKASEKASAAMRAQVEAQTRFYDALRAGDLTSEKATNRIQELSDANTIYAQELADIDADLEAIAKDKRAGNFFSDAYNELKDATGDFEGEDELKKRREEIVAITAANIAEVDKLTEAQKDNTLAVYDAAAAESARQQSLITNANINAQIEQQLLAARASSGDQIEKQIASLNAQADILETQAVLTNAAGGETAALAAQIEVYRTTASRLEGEVINVVRGLELQTKSTEDAAARVEELTAAYTEQRDALIDATESYNNDVTRIQERAYQELAAIQAKFNDAQIKAAETLANDQQKLSEKLADTIADLSVDAQRAASEAQRDFQSDQLDEIQDAQREEADAAKDHARRLRDIRENAAGDEASAVENRDFRRLFEIRRNTEKQLKEANREFNEERGDKQSQLSERLSDLAKEFAEEQQARQRDFQQRLTDAQAQAQQERGAIQARYQESKAELDKKLQEEKDANETARVEALALRNEFIQDELTLIQQGNQQKLALEQQYYQQSQAILAGTGGLANATAGAGLGGFGGFGGMTTNNNQQLANSNTFNINNTNPNVTAQQIGTVIHDYINRLFD